VASKVAEGKLKRDWELAACSNNEEDVVASKAKRSLGMGNAVAWAALP
jgi:hypothetical protein